MVLMHRGSTAKMSKFFLSGIGTSDKPFKQTSCPRGTGYLGRLVRLSSLSEEMQSTELHLEEHFSLQLKSASM